MSHATLHAPDFWLDHSDVLFSAEQVSAALDQMSMQINQRLAGQPCILMCVMRGGVYLAGQLMSRIKTPVLLDYVQASRYDNRTSGGDIVWSKRPTLDLNDQTVLLIDDILDEGVTLAEVRKACLELGAATVLTAVLTDKANGLIKPLAADFVGLMVPDRFVFGCGMDIHGWWRNLPEIRALKPLVLDA